MILYNVCLYNLVIVKGDEKDEAELRSLHDILFPIKYNDDFYHSVWNQPNMFCLVARLTPLNSTYTASTTYMSTEAVMKSENISNANLEPQSLPTTIVGFAIYTIRSSSIWSFSLSSFRSIYIRTLGTRPGYCKQGIATSILQHIKGHAVTLNIRRISLDVACSNQNAVSFYQRNSFCIHKHMPGHYVYDNSLHDGYNMIYNVIHVDDHSSQILDSTSRWEGVFQLYYYISNIIRDIMYLWGIKLRDMLFPPHNNIIPNVSVNDGEDEGGTELRPKLS